MQAQQSWHEEMQSAYLYRVIAQNESQKNRQQLFSRLAQEAEHQASIWAKHAQQAGQPFISEYKPNLRTRIVAMQIQR